MSCGGVGSVIGGGLGVAEVIRQRAKGEVYDSEIWRAEFEIHIYLHNPDTNVTGHRRLLDMDTQNNLNKPRMSVQRYIHGSICFPPAGDC